MTSSEIKKLILNYEMTEELLWEYLSLDFQITIVGVFGSLYELVSNYSKNIDMIDEILTMLEFVTKNEKNIDNIKKFHVEIKKITGNIYKNLKEEATSELKGVIRRLQVMSRYLKQVMIDAEASKKISIIEAIIFENKNLKIVSALIRDNKDILKIKDDRNENVLYKLLKKYSYLDESCMDEINYLYQVISLFLNNDDLNVEIVKNADYYISALKKRNSKHVRQMIRLLELKKQPIKLEELERRFQIFTRYPSTIERELNNRVVSSNGFVDLRNQPCFTIDGEDTECLDDAIYLEKNSDGTYTLYVSITYLPAIIPYDSKINRESIRRMETYYLVDGTYPLYPSYVSNYLASLLPYNDRYVETGIWLLDSDMTIIEDSFRLVKGIINSHHRLTYEGADEIIGSKSRDDLCRTLTNLGVFALRQRDINRVKEDYRKRENSHSSNPIHESRFVDSSVSANIVQECSLLFGRSKAEYFRSKGLPYIFRACGEQKKLDLDGKMLKNLSLSDREQLSFMVAYYTSTPERHYGLGYDAYCHGGSPARRSPDGQNQYIDEDLIFNPNPSDKVVYMWEDRTKKLVSYYNDTSQRIDAFSSQYNYLMSKKLIKKP